MSKTYLAEPPFPHADLVRENWLKHFPSIHGEQKSVKEGPKRVKARILNQRGIFYVYFFTFIFFVCVM